MSRLFDAYRAFHEQTFIPIFVQDHFDSKRLVEACLEVGCKGIEYTQRRHDAPEMIPWIRKNYPDLFLLVGSTLDNEMIVRQMKHRHPQLLTVAEIAEFGVDGFVSMLNWTEKSIRKYSGTHLIMPTAMTVGEALEQTAWGAHMQKLAGNDLGLVRRARGDAAFDYCPILVTGGQTPDKMAETYKAGAVAVGAGFDLILKGRPANLSVKEIASALREYMTAAREARAAAWPELAKADGGPKEQWLNALPHYHPFA